MCTVQNFSSYCYSHSRLCSGADNLQVHPESYASPCCHKTLRFRTNIFWNQNVFPKFSVTHCETVLTYKAEGARLLLCQPLVYRFPSHSIFAQPGCYLCSSCMAVLQGSAAWEWVTRSLWVNLEILSPLKYQSLMQNKESALNPTSLDGHEPSGLVPLGHPLHSWVAQLINPLLPRTWHNSNRKGKFRLILSSCPQQLTYLWEKEKMLLPTQVAILSFGFLSAISFSASPS